MIDEKINNSLKELEQGLKNVESARKQVEKTVSSYDGLTKTTGDYVTKLGSITTKVQELVDSIGKDYDQKIKAFEKDRDTIVNASNAASEKLSNATEEFKDSLSELKTKLKYLGVYDSIRVQNYLKLLLMFMFFPDEKRFAKEVKALKSIDFILYSRVRELYYAFKNVELSKDSYDYIQEQYKFFVEGVQKWVHTHIK